MALAVSRKMTLLYAFLQIRSTSLGAIFTLEGDEGRVWAREVTVWPEIHLRKQCTHQTQQFSPASRELENLK